MKISIKGFKSIKELNDFELKEINILIGANGAGKSNFISVFKLISKISKQELQSFFMQDGGNPDDYLFMGRKITNTTTIELEKHPNKYCVTLATNANNQLYIQKDSAYFYGNYANRQIPTTQNSLESNISSSNQHIVEFTKKILRSFKVYHFHDTGINSPIKTPCNTSDNITFKEDGKNIAPFLKMLKTSNNENFKKSYNQIISTIKLVAPFFSDFHFRDDENISLEWFQKGDSQTPLKAKLLSDGTLRFIALAVTFLQPIELMPSIIIIDEPELGLHPSAILLLSELIKSTSFQKKIIVSTQSTELVNYFSPDDIITVSRHENESVIKRLKNEDYKIWLEEYSLGQIWSNNILDDSL